jgi:hypothetical protein
MRTSDMIMMMMLLLLLLMMMMMMMINSIKMKERTIKDFYCKSWSKSVQFLALWDKRENSCCFLLKTLRCKKNCIGCETYAWYLSARVQTFAPFAWCPRKNASGSLHEMFDTDVRFEPIKEKLPK